MTKLIYGTTWVVLKSIRERMLEIQGVPREERPSTEEVVLKIADALEVDIDSHSIEISHRTQRKNSDAIIVKFLSHKDKVKMKKSRTKLKVVIISALFPGYPLEALQERDSIFLFENLTNHRRYVVNKANKMRKDGLLRSVWTIDGKISVTTSPRCKPVRDSCEQDLSNL